MVKIHVKEQKYPMFCPECGLKLLLLAEGYGDADKVTETTAAVRLVTYAIGEDLMYYVCGNCKRLLMGYGRRGFHFKILGSITDDALARLIADSLKGKEP